MSEGSSIRFHSVANGHSIDRMTLKKFTEKLAKGKVLRIGYATLAKVLHTFDDNMELELVSHIKKLADQFHGLTALKCRELAFKLAGMESIFQKTG